MKHKKSLTVLASAVSLALTGMMLTSTVSAGVVNNINNVTSPTVVLGACGTLAGVDSAAACIGAWNLSNVVVEMIHLNPFTTPSFDPDTGIYSTMAPSDSFVSKIYSGAAGITPLMAKLTGKVWPMGEPTSIKAVNLDTAVQNGKPQNCLINTSYLEGFYLDSATPKPVICSSPFLSHNRFKIAMQPATLDGITLTAGTSGKPIDLVFDADVSTTLTPYQVFSKINNNTGKRLQGYKIIVGKGVGATFQSASQLGIASQLYLSRGIDEGLGSNGLPDGTTDLFGSDDGEATFSHGLFGPADNHFNTDGYFDNQTAGYTVAQGCVSTVPSACPTAIFPTTVTTTDTIFSTGSLPSYYSDYFRDWLPFELAPKGIFFDGDSNATTDPMLMAWWNGAAWVKPDNLGTLAVPDLTPSTFVPVSAADLNNWTADSRYSVDIIEDVLNLGLNYIVKVGDIAATSTNGIGPQFTIRIIPVVGDQAQTAPWMTNAPTNGDLLPITTTTTASSGGGGGGCTIGSDSRFDSTLPALLAAGLVLLGWRRFKTCK